MRVVIYTLTRNFRHFKTAMAAELISMVCFRWVSVPDLKYSLYAGAGKLWKLEETAAGIAWAYDVPESMTRAANQAAGLLRLGTAVGIVLWWATDTNSALNLLEGRANNFLNLSLYSHVQLTAAAYLQILVALLLLPFLKRLLDTRKDYAAEFYQTRTETEDKGIRKRTVLAFVLILTAIPAVILFGIFFLNDRS